jgi:hypothetical protein
LKIVLFVLSESENLLHKRDNLADYSFYQLYHLQDDKYHGVAVMVEDNRAQQHDYDLVLWRLANRLDNNVSLPVERTEENLMKLALSFLTQVLILGLLYRGISHEDIARATDVKNAKRTINRWQNGEATPTWDKIIILSYIYRRTRMNDLKWRNQHLRVEVITTELNQR